jgi:hypothetical protein
MKYHLTLINTEGFIIEESLDLPVDDTANYSEFMSMRAVRELMLMNPTMTIIDVTPDGMPNSFTDEERMRRQLENMGIRKTLNAKGVSEYADIDTDTDGD